MALLYISPNWCTDCRTLAAVDSLDGRGWTGWFAWRTIYRPLSRGQRPQRMATKRLDVPKALFSALKREAKSLGLPLPEYVLLLLIHRGAAQPPLSALKTGSELVAYWQTERVISTRTDIKRTPDSASYARQLRARAESRTRD